MRLLHTSDWHLGRNLIQASLREAQEEFLRWLLDLAVSERVDAVLVSGDVYDRAVPSPDAVRLLDDTLAAFSRAAIPVVLISGNHDSAVRLGFGGGLVSEAGVHLRTTVASIAEPLVLKDDHGLVGIYGVPYLLPDAAMTALGAARSHESVLSAATARILADAQIRGLSRTVALAHAFVTGSAGPSGTSESERDVRVGGIGDAPAHVFDGLTYVALGHLHRPQQVALAGSDTVLRYSGSPVAFSFSERDDTKSVAIVELDADGVQDVRVVPVPVWRALRQVRGRLDDLLARATTDLADLSECWVKVVLTDPNRPASPMERLRERWPHTLTLEFDPEGVVVSPGDDLERLSRTTDPVEVCGYFVEYVDNVPATAEESVVLRAAVEAVQDHPEVGAS